MPEKRDEIRDLNSIPVGSLGLIPLESCKDLGAKVNDYLVRWRREREHQHKYSLPFDGYERDSYILKSKTPRFGTGEGKGVIDESIRGYDLYFLVDVCNYSLTYKLRGQINHMSPDDHYQDLKRLIAAVTARSTHIYTVQRLRCHTSFR